MHVKKGKINAIVRWSVKLMSCFFIGNWPYGILKLNFVLICYRSTVRCLYAASKPNTSTVVAFYAYLSTILAQTSLGPDHTIKFDVVKTNQGNGYHSGSGVFIAPQTGFYVFTWTIRVGSYGHSSPNFHSTEIVINNNVYGSSYALAISDSSRDDSGTGTVVAHVNQGDDVYIKTHSSHHGGGGILSEGFGRSSFSGWKLN